jgi:hypothetical protein
MDSKTLNQKLALLDTTRVDLCPAPLKAAFKVIPYYGFSWRTVNFDKPVFLGISPYVFDNGNDVTPWVGFCPRVKWGHTRWLATQLEGMKIRELCERLVEEPTLENSTRLYEYIQGCKTELSSGDSMHVLSSQTSLISGVEVGAGVTFPGVAVSATPV